ncbi:hypothetical protein ACOSP7_018911 [Xanthoceras sorbifolium]|uniref:DUF4005 domain-containing protein n=1 Tax=Xanthoceras sorbifolium TaxID=99658 RepID=A0ABQ8I1W7_9ROSI|nr:hypothetical protein JRO89_XS05G0145800 [Xanthoceras sorbifolium]
MAKKKSWFNLLKRFFISDTHSKPEKEGKRRKWFFGRLKVKRFASITAPTPSKDGIWTDTEEEQSKHTVAVATAAEVTIHECGREKEDDPEVDIPIDALRHTTKHQYGREILELAAIKIQTAFRGYLAKKALRALKGIVRLQAIIRGRNVRRQAITTLKCLQSIVNIQSQVCARRFQMGHQCGENNNNNKQLQTLRDKIIKMDSNGQRRWDDSVLTKEEADALFLSKKEAIMKRERIKEYAVSHRKSAESEQNKVNGRWRYWLEQWVDTQVSKSKELEDLDTIWTPNGKHNREEYRGKGVRLRSLQRQYHIRGLDDSPISVPQRSLSFHRKQSSLGNEKSFPSSPIVPTYMAATESAKAKARSMSSPKLRPGDCDTCSESYSPYKHKLSSLISSSITSEVPSSCGRIGRPSAYQQRSPSLKSVPGPIKSSRTTTIKDLSLDSECSLLNLDRQSAFR